MKKTHRKSAIKSILAGSVHLPHASPVFAIAELSTQNIHVFGDEHRENFIVDVEGLLRGENGDIFAILDAEPLCAGWRTLRLLYVSVFSFA